jgi:hypothetical protein
VPEGEGGGFMSARKEKRKGLVKGGGRMMGRRREQEIWPKNAIAAVAIQNFTRLLLQLPYANGTGTHSGLLSTQRYTAAMRTRCPQPRAHAHARARAYMHSSMRMRKQTPHVPRNVEPTTRNAWAYAIFRARQTQFGCRISNLSQRCSGGPSMGGMGAAHVPVLFRSHFGQGPPVPFFLEVCVPSL